MKNTETAAALVRALDQLNELNLDKLFASGIDVTLDSYTEDYSAHMERITLAAEDFAPVRDALRVALLQSLTRQKEYLERDLKAVIKTPGVQS